MYLHIYANPWSKALLCRPNISRRSHASTRSRIPRFRRDVDRVGRGMSLSCRAQNPPLLTGGQCSGANVSQATRCEQGYEFFELVRYKHQLRKSPFPRGGSLFRPVRTNRLISDDFRLVRDTFADALSPSL